MGLASLPCNLRQREKSHTLGMQWCPLKEEDAIPRVRAMDAHGGRPPDPEGERPGEGTSVSQCSGRPPDVGSAESVGNTDAKLLRQLQAQEKARQAAQIRLLRKLQKQEQARIAKEAKKQQAIMAAEEKRQQKEQIKIMKQQERIRRIQQIRMEKERRAQQILEAKRIKKEEAAKARLLEAEKRKQAKRIKREEAAKAKFLKAEKRKQDFQKGLAFVCPRGSGCVDSSQVLLCRLSSIQLPTHCVSALLVWMAGAGCSAVLRSLSLPALMPLLPSRSEERIRRIQQIRMEKERRAQQILEAKRIKKEEAANAKLLETEKRKQEKERSKQEKRDEKRLKKELKREQRRLELEIAKELKKPNEDMCLADQKPLPELPRIPGLVLSGSTFSNCLMVVQFLQDFGKALGFNVSTDIPNLSILQEGLLNLGDSMREVQDLLVRLLSAAVCDPGLITGYKAETALGEHLLNVGVNRDNVSEILQIFLEARCGQTELTESLRTKAFQAHTPAQKASALALLISELACSRGVASEIDKNANYMSNLRRDQWMVEGKLHKLRIIYAKKAGKRDTSGGIDLGEEQHAAATPTAGRKRRRKGGDSDADGNEEEEEAKEDKKGKKTHVCEDEDEGDQAASVEELEKQIEKLEKQIEKLSKQQSQYRRELFDASHSLRSMMFGQDRYRRQYWIFPQCGGIFVEGMESSAGPEEIAKERKKLRKAESIQIKEIFDTSDDTLNCSNPDHCKQKEDPNEKDNTNLILQKPGSFSKLCKLLEVAKVPPGSDVTAPKPNSGADGCALPHQNSGRHSPGSMQPTVTQNSMEKTHSNLFSPGSGGAGKVYSPLPSDQLLLPGTPWEDASLTHADAPAAASPTPQAQPPSKSPSPGPAPLLGSSPQNPVGLNPFALSALQMKSGVPVMGLQFCGGPTGMLNSSIPFLPPVPSVGSGLGPSEGNADAFLTPSVGSNESEPPVPQKEKVSSTQPAALEVAKPVYYPRSKPIPEEMQFGWWRIADPEDLKALLEVLHPRGIREQALQKQIQKHLDSITQACIENKDVTIIELNENEENQVTRDIVEHWSVEEQAMGVDLRILQQVEDLERRVASASLQVKGWMCPEPASEREDLVYFEHKSFSNLCKEHDGEFTGKEESSAHALERKSDNPLDVAVTRLSELERNIERRYLKSPLSTTIQIKLDNVGTVTGPAPAPSTSGDDDRIEEDIVPGLRVWRRALSAARSAAQVALCIQQLQKSIAWEKSTMEATSSLKRGRKDRKRKIEESTCGTGVKQESCTRGKKLRQDSDLTLGSKDMKKRKREENTFSNLPRQESFTSVKKMKQDHSDQTLSSTLTEMDSHEDARPFVELPECSTRSRLRFRLRDGTHVFIKSA
ncbi:bromodomain adjacent to zinc finger domain protein 2B-like [Manis javanica]|uniref:bromodomain adjacent to zinc finger domain protein 2B-like n=1 Tax=Manis javanica TaxID=9974 RepID=UPI003C6CF62B